MIAATKKNAEMLGKRHGSTFECMFLVSEPLSFLHYLSLALPEREPTHHPISTFHRTISPAKPHPNQTQGRNCKTLKEENLTFTMATSPESSPSRRRGSTGSAPTLSRRLSGGTAKKVRWIGKHLKNLTKDDDSDDELWGTSIERPSDLEDPNCPINSVPIGYVPLHQLTLTRPEVVQRHWHKTSSFSNDIKKIARKSTKANLQDIYTPLTNDVPASSSRPSTRRSNTQPDTPASRPQSRVDQLKNVGREDAPLINAASSSSFRFPSSLKKDSSRDYTPGSSSTWSGSRIGRPRRGPDISRSGDIYEPLK
ncbi:hypothetical protein H4Q26_003403 [Puccinia striiformis f. sp. tritici PST-130]|nr:hypothetical protein H4Q26_003403 [Puccinia striiformis f. sp. tritici PST-130]